MLWFNEAAFQGGHAAVIFFMGVGLAAVATPPLTALGAWAAGEALGGGAVQPQQAWLTSLGFSAIGAVMALMLDVGARNIKLLGAISKGLAVALVGSAGAIGYQLGGGGPRLR
ncbi:MAG: hypothetical protein ACOZIN_02160 [Myxococcota bacterium]